MCHSESKDLVEQRSLAGYLEPIGDVFAVGGRLESGRNRVNPSARCQKHIGDVFIAFGAGWNWGK